MFVIGENCGLVDWWRRGVNERNAGWESSNILCMGVDLGLRVTTVGSGKCNDL